MSDQRLVLEWIPGAFAVCRLPADAEVPAWAGLGEAVGFVSVTRTERELSIVVPQNVVPPDVRAERGWVAVWVAGTLEMSQVGVLSRLTGALADAGVAVFVVSTYDTDVLMIKAKHTVKAVAALGALADVSRL